MSVMHFTMLSGVCVWLLKEDCTFWVFTRMALLLKEDSEFCDWEYESSKVERSCEKVSGVESERVERRTKSHDMRNNNVVVEKKKHKDFLETTLMAEAFLSAIASHRSDISQSLSSIN